MKKAIFKNSLPLWKGWVFLILFLTLSLTLSAQSLSLPQCYSSNMVLPHGRALPIEGTAKPGERVSVEINGQKLSAKADKQGLWAVTVQPLPTGGPYTMTVATKAETLRFDNILAGEVWLCSGQSNMGFTLRESTTGRDDIPKATNSQIRLLNYLWKSPTYNNPFPKEVAEGVDRLDFLTKATWQECSPQTVPQFSAVGYYFAQALQDSLQVPVGVIHNAVGGSGIEAWIPRTMMEKELPQMLDDWTNNPLIMEWSRERAKVNMGTLAKRHPFEPTYMYDASVDMLRHFPISGVIWYQGESNAENIELHEQMFSMLVRSWREAWQMPDLPFYYVQLSSLNRPTWPEFRDSQRRLMTCLPHLGMAVSTDLGEETDVHYHNKRPLGERLARWALSQDYGRKLTPSGPLFRGVKRQGSTLEVSFDYGDGLATADGKPLRGFEIASADGRFYPAVATIDGNTVRLSAKEVKNPVNARYAYTPFTTANLVNSDRLPASTFTSESKLPTVFFTREITPESLLRIYEALGVEAQGRVCVKISTGEGGNPHYLKPDLIRGLVEHLDGTIVECCTAYGGTRQDPKKHWETIHEHGFDSIFAVDLMDEYGEMRIPVKDRTHIKYDIVGEHLAHYDFMVNLAHFKGHGMGGYGGVLKNASIGVASTHGKVYIHSAGASTTNWGKPEQDDFLESMAAAAQAVHNYMKGRVVYINVMNNLSVDCDCAGHPAAPEMRDLGICASLDPVAADQACLDMVFSHVSSEGDNSQPLRDRINRQHGTHITAHAERIGLGSRQYNLIDLDK